MRRENFFMRQSTKEQIQNNKELRREAASTEKELNGLDAARK